MYSNTQGVRRSSTGLCRRLEDGLDVFEVEPTPTDNPRLKMDNVMVTPHAAGTSSRSRLASQVQIGQETARLIQDTWPMSIVNPGALAKRPMRPAALNA
ncbi:MAG: NAD(P)-dependent oxidoreductase [Candidatus Tectomicrobia bacterium]